MRPSGATAIAVADASDVVSEVSVKPVGRLAAAAVIAQAIDIRIAKRSFMPECLPCLSAYFRLKEYSKRVGHKAWTNEHKREGAARDEPPPI
jgi:hypothetical protein